MNKEYYCDPQKHEDCGKRGCEMGYCRLTRYKECAICDAWGNPIEVSDINVSKQEKNPIMPIVNLHIVIDKEKLGELSKKVKKIIELMQKAESLMGELASANVDVQVIEINPSEDMVKQ